MAAQINQRETIAAALRGFETRPLAGASRDLFATLGYRSDRTFPLADSSPDAFLELVSSHADGAAFDEAKALIADWKSVDLVFQLTDQELSGQIGLFQETEDVNPGLLRSYLFFAIELTGEHHAAGGNYARGMLTGIARQLNRVLLSREVDGKAK